MDIVDKLGIYVVYTQYLKKRMIEVLKLLSISVYVFEENIKGFMIIC
jgi:hypothetical protein